MDEESKRMAAFTIEKMFASKHFDIMKIDTACKLMGRKGSGPAYDKLRALHCVDWGNIPNDILSLVPVWINEVLGGPRLSVLQIPALMEGNHELPQLEDSPGMLARLSGPKT